VRRIIFFFLLFLAFFFLFPRPLLAGKFGVNIGDHYGEFGEAADLVGSGGWVYIMSCPGDADILAEMINSRPDVNIVIRGQYPGSRPNKGLAISWASVIGSIPIPSGHSKIYFMPWNEPNGPGRGDLGSASAVKQYISDLVGALNDSGVRQRVFLLSPMINIYQPGFDGYIGPGGLGDGFFQQFDGIAMNLYGQYNNGSFVGDPYIHKKILEKYGVVGKPVFAVESGVLIIEKGAVVYGAAKRELIDYFTRMKGVWGSDNQMAMCAISSYDPHSRSKSPWIYSAGDVVSVMKQIGAGVNLAVGAGGVGSNFEAWRGENTILCKDTTYAYTTAANCGGCGGISVIYTPTRIVDPGSDLAFSLSDPVRLYQNYSLPAGYIGSRTKTRGGFFEEFGDVTMPFAREMVEYLIGPFAYSQNTKINEYLSNFEENKERLGVLPHLLPEAVQDEFRKKYWKNCDGGVYYSSKTGHSDEENECLIASGKEIQDIVVKPDPKKFLDVAVYELEIINWKAEGHEKEWVQIPLISNPKTEVSLDMSAELPAIHLGSCPGNEDPLGPAQGSSSVKMEVPWVAALRDASNLLFDIMTPNVAQSPVLGSWQENRKIIDLANSKKQDNKIILAQANPPADTRQSCTTVSAEAGIDTTGTVNYQFRIKSNFTGGHGLHAQILINGADVFGVRHLVDIGRDFLIVKPWIPPIVLGRGESKSVNLQITTNDCMPIEKWNQVTTYSCTFTRSAGGDFSYSCSGSSRSTPAQPYVCRPPNMPIAKRGYGDLVDFEGLARLYGPQKKLTCSLWEGNNCIQGNDTYDVNDPVWAVLKFPYLNTIYAKLSGPEGVFTKVFKPEEHIQRDWDDAGETDIKYCFTPYEKKFSGTSVISGGELGPYDYNDPGGDERILFPDGARCDRDAYTIGLNAYPARIGGVSNAKEWITLCTLYGTERPECNVEIVEN